LYDIEDRNHGSDVQLVDDVEEYDVTRMLDIMRNNFVEVVEDGIYRLIDDEEKEEVSVIENVCEIVPHNAD
jgi:hypothetical protein